MNVKFDFIPLHEIASTLDGIPEEEQEYLYIISDEAYPKDKAHLNLLEIEKNEEIVQRLKKFTENDFDECCVNSIYDEWEIDWGKTIENIKKRILYGDIK